MGALRMGEWKLLEFFEDQRVELYHFPDDFGEKTDLAAREPQRAKEMLQRLQAWRGEVSAAMPTANPDFKGKR